MAGHIQEYHELQIAFRHLHENNRFSGILLQLKEKPILGLKPLRQFMPLAVTTSQNGPTAFRQLAIKAGNCLPAKVRRQIPGPPSDPFQIWCEVLHTCNPIAEKTGGGYLGSAADGDRTVVVSHAPFLDSAEAIELCGLLTDTPTLPTPSAVAESEVQPTDLAIEPASTAAAEMDTNIGKPPKRRASPGSAQEKIRAALPVHHRYSNGSVGNREPIGTNELARLAGVAASSVTDFWKKQFGDAANYERQCANGSIVEALKLLAGDVTPRILSSEFRDS